MTFQEAMYQIESHDLAIRLNVASGLNIFLQAARNEEATYAILEAMEESTDNCIIVFKRVIELTRQLADVRYENMWDTAIALYIWLLSIKYFKLAVLAAEIIISLPQFWWARKLSYNILLGSQVYSDAEQKEENFILPNGVVASTSDSLGTGENMLFASFFLDKDEMAKGRFRIIEGEKKSIVSGIGETEVRLAEDGIWRIGYKNSSETVPVT